MSYINTCTSCGTNGTPAGCGNKGHCASGSCNKLTVFNWLSNVRQPDDIQPFEFVEIRFKNDRKSFFKNINHLSLKAGDVVAVEGNPGHDVGVVTLTGEMVRIQMRGKKFDFDREDLIKKIYRIANQKDIDKWQEVREKEYKVMVRTRDIVRTLGLEMKICDVEYQGDGNKATFYYTAEERVDFRILIKELAGAFRTRIEMRQIGYRQGAAKVGGIGSCGRELCCSTWLTDFRSVNTVAARYQQLSINPQKLAGQCGKLKCCLNFELDSYLEAVKKFPDIHTQLYTEKGVANCMKLDIFKKEIWYAYTENPITWHKLDPQTANEIIEINQSKKKVSSLEDYILTDGSTKEISFESASESDKIDRFDHRNKRRRSNKNSKNQHNRKRKPSGDRAFAENKSSSSHKNQGKSKRSNLSGNSGTNSSKTRRQKQGNGNQKRPNNQSDRGKNPKNTNSSDSK
ncbi:MAG: stage 0 sporulation family protein [Flavobacteriales bacterium]